jgi:hypothetical protein
MSSHQYLHLKKNSANEECTLYSCAADAAFRAEQQQVAIPGMAALRSKRCAASLGTIDIKKKGQMSCN